MKPLLLTLLLPYFYADQMVLQRDTAFEIRGHATPSARVTVTYDTVSAHAQAALDGLFAVQMPPLPLSKTGKTLTVTTSDHCTNTFRQVLVGDVWIAAGQSNMAWPVQLSTECKTVKEQAMDPLFHFLCYTCQMPTTDVPWTLQQIRLAKTDKAFQGTWEVVTSGNCGKMSSIAVQFGQQLRTALPEVPLGIIQVAVGGAPTEAFVSPERLQAMKHRETYPTWCLQRMQKNLSKTNGEGAHPFQPSYINRKAIQPLLGFGVKGIIWYQGESNATDETNTRPMPYDYMLEITQTLRKDYFKLFGPVPFIMTMLPKLNRPWADFRKAQEQVAKTQPHTGLIVTTDLGDERDVHPRHKTPFATRLAEEAKRLVYQVEKE